MHLITVHDYHDHSNDIEPTFVREEHPARGGVTVPFPLKLHEMLDRVERDGFDHIVSWQPHGRCFVVHKPQEFKDILPSYFKLSKIASFQRQLNLYGFNRLTRGADKGGYYHELFLRGKPALAHAIQRVKVKGTGVRAKANPNEEPNFWAMQWVATKHNLVSAGNSVSSCEQTASSQPHSPVVAPVTPPSMPLICDPLMELDQINEQSSFYFDQPQQIMSTAEDPMDSWVSETEFDDICHKIVNHVDDDDDFLNFLVEMSE